MLERNMVMISVFFPLWFTVYWYRSRLLSRMVD